MKRSFFQAAVVSILLYGCTTWTLTKRLKKKPDGNYTRMLQAILNKSWRQHPTRHQLYGHLPSITKTIQARRTRHAGHCWKRKDELISDVLLWTPAYGQAKAGRPARTYIHVRVRDVVLKTSQRRWMIGRSGERGSGIFVQAAQHDDDDDDYFIEQIISIHWINVKVSNNIQEFINVSRKYNFFLLGRKALKLQFFKRRFLNTQEIRKKNKTNIRRQKSFFPEKEIINNKLFFLLHIYLLSCGGVSSWCNG